MKTQNNILKFLGASIVIFALTFSTSSYATVSEGSNDSKSSESKDSGSSDSGSSDSGSSSTSVPLDGGLGVLLLGAAAFGIKKLRDKK